MRTSTTLLLATVILAGSATTAGTAAGAHPGATTRTPRHSTGGAGPAPAPVSDEIPQAIRDFLYAGDRPFGALHPDAPPATEGFGRLAGVWACEGWNRDPQTGAWAETSKRATWAFKYTAGGFGVQDYWHQDDSEANPGQSLGRDQELTQIRVYDPNTEMWHVAFINNTAAPIPSVRVFGTFEARQEGDDMIMDFLPRDPANQRRIIFHDITEETFQWRWEFSTDGGESWIVGSRIIGTRIDL